MRRKETFGTLAARYLEQRVVTTSYAACVRRVASACPTITVEAVNAYVRKRLEECSTPTVRTERTILLSLWKWGFESGALPAMPRGIVKVKQRRPPTKAWTVEQLRAAIDATHKLDGQVLRSGARLGVFLRAWMLLGYECGARRGDLWTLTAEHIVGDAIQWTQAKTGDGITRLLSKACLEACYQMARKSPDGTILGWACGKRQGLRLMREHLDSVGIGGTSKWLRRSGATHIEIAEPGKASLHLGHRTPGLAATNYIDWSQVRRNAPRTPTLID